MPQKTKAVANYFLDLAKKDGSSLTPMKLQKLVYFAYGWTLALLEKPLVEEYVEAWDYGPVFPSLYHEFKKYGNNSITEQLGRISFYRDEEGETHFAMVAYQIEGEDAEETKAILERIWEVYGGKSAIELSSLTHLNDSPWDKTRKANPGRSGADISDDLIELDFKDKAERVAKRKAQVG